jgi:hypothetical protein
MLSNFAAEIADDPGAWLLDEVANAALSRHDRRPCSCGGTRFTLVMRGDGSSCHAYCVACYGRPGSTLAKKDDVTYGTLTIGGGLAYVGDVAGLKAHRERLKAEAFAKANEGVEPVLPVLAVGMRVRYARPDHEPLSPRKSRKGQVAVVVSADVDLTHRKPGDKMADRETAWIAFPDRARIFVFADQLDRVLDTGTS